MNYKDHHYYCFVDICRYLDLFRAAPASFSIQHKFIYICLSFSPFLSSTGLWCQMVLDHHSRIMLMMTPREEEDQKRLHFQNPPLWMVCLLAYIQVRLFWGEGAGTIWQVDKLDTDAVIMADIKQDELWVDLLFDGTASTALAESKRFRLGHIRNEKISSR